MNQYDNQTDWMERFNQSFGQSQGGDVFLLALLVMLGLLLIFLFARRLTREIFIDQEGRHVFNDLCRAHGLTRKERRLLAAHAHNLGLKHAAAVFLCPSLFEKNEAAGENKGIARRLDTNLDALGALDAGLQAKLFGGTQTNGTLRGQTDTLHQEQAQ